MQVRPLSARQRAGNRPFLKIATKSCMAGAMLGCGVPVPPVPVPPVPVAKPTFLLVAAAAPTLQALLPASPVSLPASSAPLPVFPALLMGDVTALVMGSEPERSAAAVSGLPALGTKVRPEDALALMAVSITAFGRRQEPWGLRLELDRRLRITGHWVKDGSASVVGINSGRTSISAIHPEHHLFIWLPPWNSPYCKQKLSTLDSFDHKQTFFTLASSAFKHTFFTIITMQFSSSLYLFLGLPAAMAAAVPTVQPREESGIEGYRTEPILWEVPVFPGGENATIAGTVEEVHAELLRRNPQWDTDFPLEVAARSLGSFGGFDETHTVCGPGSFGWQFALTSVINDGIKYLRRVGGHPRHGPGPGSCGRVSCSFGGGIWWCNDVRILLSSLSPRGESPSHGSRRLTCHDFGLSAQRNRYPQKLWRNRRRRRANCRKVQIKTQQGRPAAPPQSCVGPGFPLRWDVERYRARGQVLDGLPMGGTVLPC